MCSRPKKYYIDKAEKEFGIKNAKSMPKLLLCHHVKEIPLPSTSNVCTSDLKIKPRYKRQDLELLALLRGISNLKQYSYEQLCQLLFPHQKQQLPTTVTKNCLERSLKPLKDYQKKVVQHLQKNRGLLVWHRMGSGKTLTAIAVSQCFLDAHPDHHVIVITPAGLLNNFKDEMKNSYHHILHKERYSFYSFQSFMNLAKKNKKPSCKNTLLIIDEAHNLRTAPQMDGKKKKGIMTYFISKCAEQASKVLLLTGTPLYNSVDDLIPLYNMIKNPSSLPIEKKKMLPHLSRFRCMLSFHETQKNDKDFPRRINQDVLIEMTPSYEQKYDHLVDTIKGNEDDDKPSWIKTLFGEKDLVVFLNAIRRGTNNLKTLPKENAKIQWVLEKIRSIPKDEKIVIYSGFLSSGIDMLSKLVKNYAIISGSIPLKKRKEIVDDYNQNKIRILFISKAGGEGLNLKETRHIILFEPTWNDASEEQIIARAIRFRSHQTLPVAKQDVHVYKLFHIKSEDKNQSQNIKTYLNLLKQNPTQIKSFAIPLNPYDNSCDLFLKVFIDRKQQLLNHIETQLKDLAIENC